MQAYLSLITAALIGAAFSSLAGEPKSIAEQFAQKGVAAGTYFPGYTNLCDLTMTFRDVNPHRDRATTPRRKDSADAKKSPRERSPGKEIGPTQVFDNLYFVGNAGVSAWVLGDEDGYILIDALTSNKEARETIIGGMKTLGLQPEKIAYLVITHAHGDHYGGFRYLTQAYGMPVVMSEADWKLAEIMPEHPRFGPAPALKGNIAVTDGTILSAGNAEMEIRVTPGHTMGTISPLFTVYDNGQPFRAALWGGTGFNFGVKLAQFADYAKSASNFKALAEEQDVTVFLSNHGKRDGSIEKMEQLALRVPGAPHPFDMGKHATDVFEILSNCAMAQYHRVKSGDYSN